ncbi:4-alpha-glucanotransferase [Sulfuritortus calidifontis]|uniref:4-alpha-glucanotransferase n=1 Tax=Sulfuritortus calidifontis TaxID=1914471 RepID=A0A4R3JYY0_9PROT|nr:4-alpha-glucanotransferase [Sulfuritortus calidifontis]TCS72204.1 4-alpha-glucanotransferase [Sulfuritortus calidifontis]
MSAALHQLCELVGILPDYYDIWGHRHETSDATRRALLEAMGIACASEAECAAASQGWQEATWRRRLPPVRVAPLDTPIELDLHLPERAADRVCTWRLTQEDGHRLHGQFTPAALEQGEARELDGAPWRRYRLYLPPLGAPGYHRLEIDLPDGAHGLPLIVHPRRCHQPACLGEGGRVWGLSVQLYGVRSRRNWGMGDFGDLGRLLAWAAQNGAACVGVNPLHALYPHNPLHISPYSPSSRQFVNTLYLDVEAVPEFADCAEARAALAEPAFQAKLQGLRAAELVDYAGVAEAKGRILPLLYHHFRTSHLAQHTARAKAFRAFQQTHGEDLRRFALYQALQAHLHAHDATLWGWPVWPEAWRDPNSREVQTFAAAHAERIEYFEYLQWLAEDQLAELRTKAERLGLGIGLYQDLAVGVDKGGAETWAHHELFALEARTGCPPDDFNPRGQDWGLPPWIPHRLREAGYAPFIAALRANMRHAGALRLDHVMGLMRLYWVPPGMQGDAGAYLSYPFADLLGILALESLRNQCLIIGEDLGTVPDEVRHKLHEYGVLSYKLFYFEREPDGHFRAPGHFPAQSLVAASTHDLATLKGFWQGGDITLREQLQLYPSEHLRASQIAGREADRWRLLQALERDGLLPEGVPADPAQVPELTPELIQAIHQRLARSPAQLFIVQAEDMLGETEQANLPGTVDEHPNWRRKLSVELEAWPGDARTRGTARALGAERPGGAGHPG